MIPNPTHYLSHRVIKSKVVGDVGVLLSFHNFFLIMHLRKGQNRHGFAHKSNEETMEHFKTLHRFKQQIGSRIVRAFGEQAGRRAGGR